MNTTKNEIKELRRRIKNAHARFIHAGKKPRRNPVFEGAAIGFAPTPFDIRAGSNIFRYRHMKPSLESLAEIYPCSRQRLHQLAQTWGREILCDPEMLARVLTKQAQQKTPLLTALADPAERQRIAAKIKNLTA